MDDPLIMAVDAEGRFHGQYVSRASAHAGDGIHHLAITLFLSNSQGEVLLQRRKHRIFDNLWDNSGSTHPHHLVDGHDESGEEAARRCLKKEWGIGGVALTVRGGFNYFARDGRYCENEYCLILTGTYDGKVTPNPEVAYEHCWMAAEDFRRELRDQPGKYTPWCREAVFGFSDVLKP